MKIIKAHWTLHPQKAEGLYYDKNGKPRSPWYDNEIKMKNMTPASVARELDMSDELSVEGIVFPEFKESHIFKGEYKVNPHLPVIRTIDYGGCCACLFSQKQPNGGIIFFHELIIHKGGSSRRLAQEIVSHSGEFECSGFRDYDDPAGSYDTWVNGTNSADIMREYGINPTHKVTGSSGRKRTERIEMIHFKLMERVGEGEECIQVHESCKYLIDAFQSGYRHPELPNGDVDIDSIDEIHPYEDVMDCFGMTLVEEFTIQNFEALQLPRRSGPRNPYTGR